MLRSPKARDQFAKEQFYPMWEGPSKSDYILTVTLPVSTLPAGLLQAAASSRLLYIAYVLYAPFDI